MAYRANIRTLSMYHKTAESSSYCGWKIYVITDFKKLRLFEMEPFKILLVAFY